MAELEASGRDDEAIEWHRSEVTQLKGKRLPVRYGLVRLNLVGEEAQFLLSLIEISAELQAEREYQRLIEAKSRFVANMSHEVRTPLHGVMGNLELIKSLQHLPAEANEPLDTALRSGQHLTRVVDDILDFSKLDAGSFTLIPKASDLKQVIQQAMDLMAPLAAKKDLGFDLYLPDRSARAKVDAVRLQQMLNNVVGNAIKFTHDGGVSVRATWQIEGVSDMGTLTLTVSDSGIGIAADQIGRLFDPFMQGEQQRDKSYSGTGLGLSITQRLVESMAGNIEVESDVETGTRVEISLRLPVATAAEVEAIRAQATSDRDDTGSIDLTGRCVLVVDDTSVNRTLAIKMCRQLGADTLAAGDGLEAIVLFEQHGRKTDVILMDIQMPKLDGIAATHKIRELDGGADVPIIAMTANVQREEQMEYERAGMNGFLPKPFNARSLESVLAQALSSRD